MMVTYKMNTERYRHTDIKNFVIKEWYDMGQLFINHIMTEINPPDVSTKAIVCIIHIKQTERIME